MVGARCPCPQVRRIRPVCGFGSELHLASRRWTPRRSHHPDAIAKAIRLRRLLLGVGLLRQSDIASLPALNLLLCEDERQA